MFQRKFALTAVIVAAALAAGAVPAAVSAAAAAPDTGWQRRGAQVTSVRYGPFTIPAASGH
ncbi:hypothetical protein, partial [Streptomyces indiaensis]